MQDTGKWEGKKCHDTWKGSHIHVTYRYYCCHFALYGRGACQKKWHR